MPASDVILMGFTASFCASLGTAAGSLGVFAIRRLSRRMEDGLLSLAAGIMLAATFFSLLLPALEYASADYQSDPLGGLAVATGTLLGAFTLFAIHQYVPHEHFISGREGGDNYKLGRIWLFVTAITLHNFPEGLAVAVALLSVGYSAGKSALIGILSGLVEPVGGLIGAIAVSSAAVLMPWALAFAAGAMLFIISDEIIPETHNNGNQNLATFTLLTGFVIMMLLDTSL